MTPPDPAAAGPLQARRGLFAFLRDETFRSLQTRDYRLYFFGQIVSLTGSWMQSAALLWLVYHVTASPLWPPLMLVAQVAPTLFLGAAGGNLADRLPKRQLLQFTQAAYLANAAVLVGLVVSGQVTAGALVAVQLVNGVIQAVDLPTRLAYVPSLVPRAHLMNAVSLNSLIFNSARAIGPALAGGLFLLAELARGAGWFPAAELVRVGTGACFLVNGLSYLAVLAALRAISVSGHPRPRGERGSPWAGFRAVLARPELGGLLLAAGALSCFAWPTLTLFPAYTKLALVRAETEYSLLVSALGGGALVAALAVATYSRPERRRGFLLAGPALAACGLFGLTFAPELAASFPLALAAAATLGFGLVLFLSTAQSTLQLSVGDDNRGRVMALWPMMLSASTLAGHALSGVALARLDVQDVLTILSLGALAAALGIAFVGRRVRTQHAAPAGAGAGGG